MIIRRIEPEDIFEVLKIEYECFRFPYPPNMINFLYSNYRDTFLVAEVDRIAGYLIGISYDDEGHIISLAVREEYRNLGIGKSLMDRIMRLFESDEGLSIIRLEVRESNERAISFYKSLGFRVAERLELYYEDNEDAFVMVKEMG